MLKKIASYLGTYRRDVFWSPFAMVGEVICEMLIPALMGLLVDNGIYQSDPSYVTHLGGLMLLVAVGGFFSGCAGSYFASKASAGLAKNLRKEMFVNIQKFSFANIDRFSTAGLVTRLTTDVTNIQNASQMILRGALRAPAMIAVAMILSFLISPRLALIYLVVVILLGIFMFTTMFSASKCFRRVFARYDALNESVEENVSAMRVVKAYVREDHETTKFQKASADICLLFQQAELRLSWNTPVSNAAIYCCILLISWLGAHMIVQSTLTTGALMSLLTYCMNIMQSILFVAMIVVTMTMSEASARRILEVIDEKPSITNREGAVETVKDGSIDFDHVTFSYRQDAKEPVLKDVTLHIRSGETIGILGGTGSAKTSLVNLISRLYDVSSGSVKVGGIDVRDYDTTALRKSVSVVLQKNVLFSGTILDNLRWGDKNASDEACMQAARTACADEFIQTLPDGYRTWIEQGGSNVSGGQKQRLCIARALLLHPKVLIFDDSTSAVDTATEAKIRKNLRETMPEVTKLVIAQRISSVKDCDRILVLDNGQISGFDTHEKLLASNKIYQEVCASQMGMAEDADFDPKR
ncbi:MAG: ABC transporter ATP-binding protein [Lachnospiraceae bacterium]